MTPSGRASVRRWARSFLARAVVSLVAPNVPLKLRERTVVISMPDDLPPSDIIERIQNEPNVSVVEWHDERIVD
jgi:hypothetical protein